MRQATSHRIIVALLLCALIAAALTPSFGGDKLPTRCALQGVPYVQQQQNYCGPASLASVLQYWGHQTDQQTIGKVVYDKALQATNGADMILYARSKGFSAYSWNSNLEDLKEKLALGIPIIVLQDSSPTDRSGHFRVATGYDDKEQIIYVNDPYEPETEFIPYDKFTSLWARYGNWSLLVCSPERDQFKVALDEKNPTVHIDLAYVYLQRNNLEASERECRLALALEPSNYSAKDILNRATRALGARSKSEPAAK